MRRQSIIGTIYLTRTYALINQPVNYHIKNKLSSLFELVVFDTCSLKRKGFQVKGKELRTKLS